MSFFQVKPAPTPPNLQVSDLNKYESPSKRILVELPSPFMGGESGIS